MNLDLVRQFEKIENTGVVLAGYTSGLCGEWTEERFGHLAEELKVDSAMMIMANQHHTDQVKIVGLQEAGEGVIKPQPEEYFDAMITAQKGIMLCVHTADCVPIVFLDPVKEVVAIAHSGWVGCSKGIAGKTVRRMAEEYQCRPVDIICGIGPYNRSCCYEVGEDVLEHFRESFSDRECGVMFKKKNQPGKYMLDLGNAISLSLCREGVKWENIYEEGWCTYHTTQFSSWRRTGDRKKQIATYIMLRL